MELSRELITRALELVGAELERRGVQCEVVVIGGANLIATELVPRTTDDVDVVAIRRPDGTLASALPLPNELQQAVVIVADVLGLSPYWMNGQSSMDFHLGLPPGCEQRFTEIRHGGLMALLAARQDIVAWKLLAAGERYGEPGDQHLADLRVLRPSRSEIDMGLAWCTQLVSPSSAFWSMVERVIDEVVVDD